MINKIGILYACFSLLVMIGCKNDLDINAPEKETMIIYGLLNANDSVHYIKVNQGFISDTESAITMAKDVNRLFYDSLRVEIFGSDKSHHIFVIDSSIAKEPGDFSNEKNYLYRSEADLLPGINYQLKVTNLLTGNVAEANTTTLGGPVEPPIPGEILFTTEDYSIPPDQDFIVRYISERNGDIYEIILKMYYDEVNTSTSTVRRDTLEWKFASGKFNSSKTVFLKTRGQLFYDYVGAVIPDKGPQYSIRPVNMEIEFLIGDGEMSIYKESNGSSVGIVQKRTDYTNIKNGYGLFASRYNYKVTNDDVGSRQITFFQQNKATGHLRFVN